MKMKNFLMPLIALGIALVSCQKETPSTPSDPSVKPQEQIAYIDEVGETALTQIEPKDFQTLADMVKAVTKDSLDIELDSKSLPAVILLIFDMYDAKSGKLVIDTDKLTGTLTINGKTASYESGSDRKVVYKNGADTYTAKLDITKGSKQVKLGSYELELSASQKMDVDVYLIVPSAVKADIYSNGTLYMGGEFQIDASSMPSDWSELTFTKMNGSVSGTAFINGNGSYNAKITNLSANSGKVTCEGTVYGNKGAFLSSGKFSGTFHEDEDDDLILDPSTVVFYGNLIDKIESKANGGTAADIYFTGDSSVQLSVDTVDGKVTFADGSVNTVSNLLNETNFPKTFAAGMPKLEEFINMFGLEEMVVAK